MKFFIFLVLACLIGPSLVLAQEGEYPLLTEPTVRVLLGVEKTATTTEFVATAENSIFTFRGARYRGNLTVVENASGFLVINTLPLEQYVAGVVETSELGSSSNYLRAMAVVVRSYALNKIQTRAKNLFDVYASTNDQLYKGYGAEIDRPKWKKAVTKTRGMVVTYAGEPVLTPYFAQSAGTTKSFKAVWGGKEEKPWLIPVKTNYDKASKRKLYGHGVGLSQKDAANRAETEGLSMKDLLGYYYVGTAVERWYK